MARGVGYALFGIMLLLGIAWLTADPPQTEPPRPLGIVSAPAGWEVQYRAKTGLIELHGRLPHPGWVAQLAREEWDEPTRTRLYLIRFSETEPQRRAEEGPAFFNLTLRPGPAQVVMLERLME